MSELPPLQQALDKLTILFVFCFFCFFRSADYLNNNLIPLQAGNGEVIN